jgi:cysteine rich repeat protein
MTNLRHGMFAALALAVVVLPSSAFAEFKPSPALRSACMNDAFKLCSSSLGSMDRVLACLSEKKSQTSPKCQAQYEAETKTAAKK